MTMNQKEMDLNNSLRACAWKPSAVSLPERLPNAWRSAACSPAQGCPAQGQSGGKMEDLFELQQMKDRGEISHLECARGLKN